MKITIGISDGFQETRFMLDVMMQILRNCQYYLGEKKDDLKKNKQMRKINFRFEYW